MSSVYRCFLASAQAGLCGAKGADDFVNLEGSFILVAFTNHALQNEWNLPRLNVLKSTLNFDQLFILICMKEMEPA